MTCPPTAAHDGPKGSATMRGFTVRGSSCPSDRQRGRRQSRQEAIEIAQGDALGQAIADERLVFTSAILAPHLRKSRSIEELIPWLYLKGVPTGDYAEATSSSGSRRSGAKSTKRGAVATSRRIARPMALPQRFSGRRVAVGPSRVPYWCLPGLCLHAVPTPRHPSAAAVFHARRRCSPHPGISRMSPSQLGHLRGNYSPTRAMIRKR